MTKFESEVKVIPYSQERIFEKLADLNNLESIKDRIPKDKVQEISFDRDSLSFTVSPVGNINLQIIAREPHKCIKFETVASPLPFNLWIQLVPVSERESKLTLLSGLEVIQFLWTMFQEPYKGGLDNMVERLATIPY